MPTGLINICTVVKAKRPRTAASPTEAVHPIYMVVIAKPNTAHSGAACPWNRKRQDWQAGVGDVSGLSVGGGQSTSKAAARGCHPRGHGLANP